MLLIVDSVAFPGRLHVIQGGENSPKARRVAATSRASRLCPCLGESGSAQACRPRLVRADPAAPFPFPI